MRKAAQQGVCAILRGSDCMFGESAPSHHPAAVTTAKYCIKEMEQAGGRLISGIAQDFRVSFRFFMPTDLNPPALFEQVARKIRPRCMFWG